MRNGHWKEAKWTMGIVASLWLGGIALGGILMIRHEFTPGESSPAPTSLSDNFTARFPTGNKKLTLFMSVHPNCPCTGASIEQLDRFLAKHSEAQAVALFAVQEDGPSDPENLVQNGYWKRLNKMNTIRVVVDKGGLLSDYLGARVSGSVAAYDSQGRLRFQGGLTATRGHPGPSQSLDVLANIVEGDLCETSQEMLAFGCKLTDDS